MVHYEGGMMTIDTLAPHHEDVDKNGKPMLKAVAPARYRIVDPAEVEQIIEATYKNPGLGATRGVSTIFKLLSRSYLGISQADVEQTLLRIVVYRSRLKPNARKIQPQLSDQPYPMSHVKMDLMDMSSVAKAKGNKGYNWLLNLVDMHSRFAWSIPLKTKHASVVAFELEKLFLVELRPSVASFSTIGADQGSEFKADVIRLVANFELTFSRGSPYNSSTQGLVEAFNKTLQNMLARQTDESGTF
jgi:IS30 family transposase